MKLNQLTIKEARDKLRIGEISSVEITKACLKRIKDVDNKVHACLTVCEKEAINAAQAADQRRTQGEDGNLLGIPFLAKDNIMTRGVKTTAASKILENYIAPYDATVIKRLKSAGAVLLGKTNLDEFAHGASTENSAYGPTHNPWDLERVPGGSSGGSAAGVAADMCLFALGTDTGGSVRHPASLCGVVGLKPTYGRSSRFGLIAMTSSTDVPGTLTKTVEDAALVLLAIAGHDKNDATTPEIEIVNYLGNLEKTVKGLTIGIAQEYFSEGIEKGVLETVKKSIESFKGLGIKLIDISLPHAKYGNAAYYIITPSEISSNLARFDGVRYGFTSQDVKDLVSLYKTSRGKGFGPEAKRRIMLGSYALSAGYYDAYYLKAQKVRTIIKTELDEVFKQIDCVLTPTTPTSAFLIGEKQDDPLSMYLEDVFATGASLAGLPAISLPCGFSENLPVGMQLIGKHFEEARIFQLGHAWQQITDHHKKRPQL